MASGNQDDWQVAQDSVSPKGTWLPAVPSAGHPKMDLGHLEGRCGKEKADRECESKRGWTRAALTSWG